MIAQTIPITGRITEIRDGRVYTSSGDRRDSYNQRYYRPSAETVEIRRHAPRKDKTFANLLQLAIMARTYRGRDVYTRQYLTMAHRRLQYEAGD
jgi:hypothetical protein